MRLSRKGWIGAWIVAQVAVVALIACSSGTPSGGPSGSQAPDANAPPIDPNASGGGTDAPSPSGSTPESSAATDTPSGPGGDITNDPPDGGMPMNNAQTSKDGGASDRLKPIMDVVGANRDKFRACFDAWGHKNPGKEVKITFSIKLKSNGELHESGFVAAETDVSDATMQECMQTVTQGLKFPASPKGMETTYRHRFQFKAKS